MTEETIFTAENVRKEFGSIVAVDDVSLKLYDGEFFTLLGPSGSGKSTLLRMIAGLETPTQGRLHIGGVDITDQPANERNTALIFQNFALFPHKTVGENIAFPLKMQGSGADERERRARELLEFVDLDGYYDRYPDQLSGGEQQRVALARGLSLEPEILLLDEPLANLDRKLRQQLELELRLFQRQTDTTFVYVTHNQEEALTMSDRIGVMRDGNIDQIAAPTELYENPSTSFVAQFLGEANQFVGEIGTVEEEGELAEIRTDAGRLSGRMVDTVAPGDEAELLVKVEDCELQSGASETSADSDSDEANVVEGTVIERLFLGSEVTFLVDLADVDDKVTVRASKRRAPPFDRGDEVVVTWPSESARLFAVSAASGPSGGRADDDAVRAAADAHAASEADTGARPDGGED